MSAVPQNPPRNGEGDRAKRGGGALAASRPNVERARSLRRQMSLPEVILWRALRMRPEGLKFRRQHPIGGYVADFACLSARLLIEVDGEAHDRGNQSRIDALRQIDLERTGFRVLRIAARDVLENIDGVIRMIVTRCGSRPPLHQPWAGPPPRSGEDL
ncbi:MAG: endonuclease domain-containing protein [Bradyrhizobium sp.]|nr:endonuclease domain-containing protein [Bradyrhizobium sp.]